MKRKSQKSKLTEINNVYNVLGLNTEEARKYLLGLGNISDKGGGEKKVTFIEADINSCISNTFNNAELESTTK